MKGGQTFAGTLKEQISDLAEAIYRTDILPACQAMGMYSMGDFSYDDSNADRCWKSLPPNPTLQPGVRERRTPHHLASITPALKLIRDFKCPPLEAIVLAPMQCWLRFEGNLSVVYEILGVDVKMTLLTLQSEDGLIVQHVGTFTPIATWVCCSTLTQPPLLTGPGPPSSPLTSNSSQLTELSRPISHRTSKRERMTYIEK